MNCTHCKDTKWFTLGYYNVPCYHCRPVDQDAIDRFNAAFAPKPMPEGWPVHPAQQKIIDTLERAQMGQQAKEDALRYLPIVVVERDEARQQRDEAESRERSWISECLMHRRAQETNQTAFDKVLAERDTLLETTGQQAEKIKAMGLAIHGVTEWLDHPHEPKHSAEWRAGWDCLLNLHLREVIEGFKDDAQAACEEWSSTYGEVLDAQDESKRLAAELAERDETIAALISTFQERFRAMHRRAQKAEMHRGWDTDEHWSRQREKWLSSAWRKNIDDRIEIERLRAELARKGGE